MRSWAILETDGAHQRPSVITMVREFQSGDVGKRVVTSDGDEVGTIEKIESNMATVRPESSLAQSIRRRLGWTEESEDVYELRHSRVQDISGDEVHLKD